jgi:hypothetical protein
VNFRSLERWERENETKPQVDNLLSKAAQAIRLLTCMRDVPLLNPDQLRCQVFVCVVGGMRDLLDGTVL